MKIEIRLKIDAGEVNAIDEDVLELDKPHDALERIGLSLDEAKDLLGRLQERIVAAQAAAFEVDSRSCPAAGTASGARASVRSVSERPSVTSRLPGRD